MGEMVTGLGTLLLGGVFAWSGIDHFLRFTAVKGMLAARGWPAPGALLALASTFEIAAGLCLVAGIGRPLAALGLAGFTLVATVLLLDFWRFDGPASEAMRAGFVVNFAVVGGLLLAAGL